MAVEPGRLSTVWRKWEIECFGAEKEKYDQVSPMNILVNVRMRPSIRCLSANYASLFSLVLGFAHGRRFTGQSSDDVILSASLLYSLSMSEVENRPGPAFLLPPSS